MVMTRFDPSARFIKDPKPSQEPTSTQRWTPPSQPRPGHAFRASSSSAVHHRPSTSSSQYGPTPPNPHSGLRSPHNSQMWSLPPFPFPSTYLHSHAPPPMMPTPPFPILHQQVLSPPSPPFNMPDQSTFMRKHNRIWSTSMVDCLSDMKTCAMTLLCPCLTFGQISETLNEGTTNRWEYAILFFVPICCSGCQYLVFHDMDITYIVLRHLFMHPAMHSPISPMWLTLPTKFLWVIPLLGVCTYRMKMRNKFNLQGNCFWDLICTSLCFHLVLCQQYRQLARFGYKASLGWRANKNKHQKIMKDLAKMVPPEVPRGMDR